MKKICFLINSLVRSGAERVVVNLAEHFLKNGYEVRIVTPLTEENGYEISEGIQRIYSEPPKEMLTGSRIKNFFIRLLYLRQIWKKERPDIIVSFIGKLNMMAILSSWGMRIPVLVSVRSDPNREYKGTVLKMLSKTLFGKADGVIVQTKQAQQYFPCWIKRKSIILPNPLNEQFIRPFYTGKKECKIVSVGRLDANKNQIMLMNAFQHITEEFPEYELYFYGEGVKEEEWKKYCAEVLKNPKIHFEGRMSNIPELIAPASIFVLTSKVEGMPNALIEAMALGIAVISTDCPCGGPASLIESGKNGILIPVDDEKALEEALRNLLGNPKMMEDISQEAYKIAEVLAPEKVNRQWQDYIESKLR